MQQIVTKSEFAGIMGRTPACVSHWINNGKISPAALVGTGNRAKICVERAKFDLATRLDPTEQDKQEQPILSPSDGDRGSAAPQDEVTDIDMIRRKRRAEAELAEHQAEAARRKLAIDEGRWVEASDAQAAWGRELTNLVNHFENFVLRTLPRDIAERHHGCDLKAETIHMGGLFRKWRVEIADVCLKRSQELEEIKADDLEKFDHLCSSTTILPAVESTAMEDRGG